VKLPFRRRKRFLVRLTARGKQLPLGVIEAKDTKDLMSKLTDMLQSNEAAKQYPAIRIMDMESGTEVRVANPFAEVEDTSVAERGGRSGESFLEALAEEAVKQNLIGAFTFLSQLMAESVKTFGGALVNVIKDITMEVTKLRSPPQEQSSGLRDIVEAGKLMLALYTAWSQNPEAFDRFFREKVSKFLGVEVGKGGESKPSK
jgi:hypothetical protein